MYETPNRYICQYRCFTLLLTLDDPKQKRLIDKIIEETLEQEEITQNESPETARRLMGNGGSKNVIEGMEIGIIRGGSSVDGRGGVQELSRT